MTAFILNWNPSKWAMPDEAFDQAVEVTAEGGEHPARWSVGVRTDGIEWGDRAYLLRQHQDRGLIAEGYFTSGVTQGDHWDGSDRLANYADIAWTTWLPLGDRLPTETLIEQIPAINWNRLQESGTRVPHAESEALAVLCEDHLDSVGRSSTYLPDEVPPSQGFPEGATTKVLVNRYERSPRARQACIGHHGTACAVCGFDFGEVYGDLGGGCIHVHHIRPLSELPDGYEVDPKKDLVPVCPNCHAMIHKGPTTLSVEERRHLIA
jgi:5-methylcytosine-specific restriction protein A